MNQYNELVNLLIDEKAFAEFVLMLKERLKEVEKAGKTKNADGVLFEMHAKRVTKDIALLTKLISHLREPNAVERLIADGITVQTLDELLLLLLHLTAIRVITGHLPKGATYDSEIERRTSLMRNLGNELKFVSEHCNINSKLTSRKNAKFSISQYRQIERRVKNGEVLIEICRELHQSNPRSLEISFRAWYQKEYKKSFSAKELQGK